MPRVGSGNALELELYVVEPLQAAGSQMPETVPHASHQPSTPHLCVSWVLPGVSRDPGALAAEGMGFDRAALGDWSLMVISNHASGHLRVLVCTSGLWPVEPRALLSQMCLALLLLITPFVERDPHSQQPALRPGLQDVRVLTLYQPLYVVLAHPNIATAPFTL